jgi:hypothetical protein
MTAKSESLADFLESLKEIPWLSHAGEPYEDGIVVADAVEGWDGWNERMYEVWRPRTEALEDAARREIGDAGIDRIFEAVSQYLRPVFLEGLTDYFSRRPIDTAAMKDGADAELYEELLEAMTRDVCWAAIEAVLGRKGFFTDLVRYYRAGRWPCAWEGEYPKGRVVVL